MADTKFSYFSPIITVIQKIKLRYSHLVDRTRHLLDRMRPRLINLRKNHHLWSIIQLRSRPPKVIFELIRKRFEKNRTKKPQKKNRQKNSEKIEKNYKTNFLGLTNGSSEIPESKPVSDSAQPTQPSSTQPPAGAIQHLIQSPRIGAPGGFQRAPPTVQQPPTQSATSSPATPLQPKLP